MYFLHPFSVLVDHLFFSSKNNDGALDSDNDDYEEDMDSGNDKSSDENFKQVRFMQEYI